ALSVPALKTHCRLDIELERLALGPFGGPHGQDLAHHVCEPHRYGQAIIVVAGIVVDLRQSHDVAQDRFERWHGALASECGDEEWVRSFRSDVRVKLGYIAVRPEISVLVVQQECRPPQHWIVTITEELRFPTRGSDADTN